MKLMTKELEETIPSIESTSELTEDKIMVPVKFFNPCGAGTWYVIGYDPENRICYGYVTGLGYNELGSFSVDELEAVKGPLGIGIERDLYWKPKTLAEIMEKEPYGG